MFFKTIKPREDYNIETCMASSLNNVIGIKDNNKYSLPWKLHDDMVNFRNLTTNGIVVMGSNTFDSMDCKPLKNRYNIVLTTNPSKYDKIDKQIKEQNILQFKCIDDNIEKFIKDIIKLYQTNFNKENLLKTPKIFIIGGTSIYEIFKPYVTYHNLTTVFNEVSPKYDIIKSPTYMTRLKHMVVDHDDNFKYILVSQNFVCKSEKNQYDYVIQRFKKINNI